jgi:L-threonylcarbamoyladenylate synthase
MAIVTATQDAIERAGEALARGDIVAFPTETVYGLGANALDASAVAKVFAAKERPCFNPLIVHVLGVEEAETYAVVNATARKLTQTFWPGPLSLVLPRRPDCAIPSLVSAGLDTIALRAPAHAVARALLKAAKVPIAAPSANRFGRVSPTAPAHVEAELGGLPSMILDGGPCPLGLESTVVGVVGDTATLLRVGALRRQGIEAVLGRPLIDVQPCAPIISPGQTKSHYAPRTPLRLDVTQPQAGEALLAFGPDAPAFAGPTINLSPCGDLDEAAMQFFAALRNLDGMGARAIAVMQIPDHGLGEAINDRLRRAAAAGVSPPIAADMHSR